MSTLFGHTRGSYTGANQKRDGLLLNADKGILFLDEVGELGPDEQAMLLRAIEEKSFFPVGADKETKSDFQLIAGTNRDLKSLVASGLFREDLLARINLWCFQLPGLKERKEDLAPNLEYELDRYSQKNNIRVSFNKEAHAKFLKFATSSEALWTSNFRDLNAAITRMATLAQPGRISVPIVEEEIERLIKTWSRPSAIENEEELYSHFGLSTKTVQNLDPFDQVQLLEVLRVCRTSRTLSEAGRELFSVSRKSKAKSNDADRLRKYLQKFGITWVENNV